jgi:hypothetical protein
VNGMKKGVRKDVTQKGVILAGDLAKPQGSHGRKRRRRHKGLKEGDNKSTTVSLS